MKRNMLCRCEDVDTREVHEAIRQGHDDLESLRRYTAIGTGPCQGKACIQETIRVLAEHHDVDEASVGQITLRPPFAPVPLGMLAGLDPDALERLLTGEESERARRTREALEDESEPRTGRATPGSVKRSMRRHREETGNTDDRDPDGRHGPRKGGRA